MKYGDFCDYAKIVEFDKVALMTRLKKLTKIDLIELIIASLEFFDSNDMGEEKMRQAEILIVKDKIKELIKQNKGKCGLFYIRNSAGDELDVLFSGKYIKLEFCKCWDYFEVFGLEYEEILNFRKFYDALIFELEEIEE